MTYTREAGRAFWFEFDDRTKYDNAFRPIIAAAGAFDIQAVFAGTREEGSYPAAFDRFVQVRRAAWERIAGLQREILDSHFGDDPAGLQSAFEDFGAGVLHDSDPVRARNDDMIHTMDMQSGSPPIGYHRWHASVRAIESLGLGDPAWLARLAQLIGLAWAIQSAARPVQRNSPNPDVRAGDLRRLREAWLALTPESLDRQYDLTGSTGYHPAPFEPS